MTDLEPAYIVVPRTARYYVLGTPTELVRDLWIVCHGFAQLGRDFAALFKALEDDSRLIVAPEATSRFYLDTDPSHGRSSKIGATWMTREARDYDIADIVSYLDALYDRLLGELAAHGVERDRIKVHALGFSQGAPAVMRWAGMGSAVVDHLVGWGHGIPEDVNVRALGERRPNLTIDLVYGERDRFISPEAVVAQRTILDGSGVPYEIHTFKGGHVLNTILLRELMRETSGGSGQIG